MINGKRKEDYITDLVIKNYSDKEVLGAFRDGSCCGLMKYERILTEKYFRPGTSVLDIACGSGRTSLPLAGAGHNVVGIDIAPGMIALANGLLEEAGAEKKLKVEFKLMNAMDLKFPDSSFDNVLFSDCSVLHLPGKEGKQRAFAEICRVLKPGGCFIFSTHPFFALGSAPTLLKRAVSFYCEKLLGIDKFDREFGEFICSNTAKGKGTPPFCFVLYEHIMPPFIIENMLNEAGFEIIYRNLAQRIELGKKPPALIFTKSHGKKNNYLLYVARKPIGFGGIPQ